MSESLSLAFGLRFEDLYRRDGLVRLDGCFVEFLKRRNADLHNRLMAGRAAPEGVAGKDYSDLIVELAVELEDFIAALFGIARDVEALRSRHGALAPLYAVKRLFVQRRAAKKYSPEQAAEYAAWTAPTPQGQHRHKDGVLFKLPRKIDPHRLVPVETEVVDGIAML